MCSISASSIQSKRRGSFAPLLLGLLIGISNCGKGTLPGVNQTNPTASTSPSKSATARTTIYFVRHAQTMALFTGHYSGKTEDEFSPKAPAELKKLVQELHKVHFDAAIVSPAWRTMHTALPVLKDHILQAEIWPELYECCDQHGLATRKIPAHKGFRYMGKVTVPTALKSSFRIDPSDDRRFAYGNYQDGLKQIRLEVKKVIQKFGGKGLTILVVGHGYNGSRFIAMMEGLPPSGRVQLGTTGVVKLVEDPTLSSGKPSPRFQITEKLRTTIRRK